MTKKKKNPSLFEGRPTKYKEEYCETIIDYFTVTVLNEKGELNPPPTLYGFAGSIGVCHDTLCEWANVHPKFSESVKKAKSLQADFIINASFRNKSNPAFSIFMMKNNHGWVDKKEITEKLSQESIEEIIRKAKGLNNE